MVGSLHRGRSAMTASLLANGTLLVVGGYGFDEPTSARISPEFANHKSLDSCELGTLTTGEGPYP